VNFLAHVLLAGERPADQLGGVLGDFAKGPLPCGLSPELANGVALHRFVDRFTDGHPVFIGSCQRISPERRRFAGIMMDMVYDHFLARHWSLYCEEPLPSFSQRFYGLLEQHQEHFPPTAWPLLESMRRQDWLCGYADLDVIGRALNHISRSRLKRANTLAGAQVELEAQYVALEQDFRRFMPEVLDASQSWRLHVLSSFIPTATK
jgi:acyl carrier protein phosphodiesterase